MRYKLTEQYFRTDMFQQTVGLYFDTVLKGLLNLRPVIQAKGLFEIDGKVKSDLYDMPYHIHILNGLIPALFVYEYFCEQRGLLEHEDMGKYLKTLILGFTFHDSDKLIGQTWDAALSNVEKMTERLNVKSFFQGFDKYKNDVFFLSLATEDRTSVMKNQYKVELDYIHLTEILALICKFADGLASIQELDGVEVFFKEAQKAVNRISKISNLEISYIKIQENPYTLLSQHLLNIAGRVLTKNNRKVLYAMRDGIIFFGKDLKDAEKKQIFETFEQAGDDIDIHKLTKIDAQKCSFGFLGSVELTKDLLDDIIEHSADNFLRLSPNGSNTINFFDDFVRFNELLIAAADLPINIDVKSDRISLYFSENALEEFPEFVKLFALQKIMWLNSRSNKDWNKSFQDAVESNRELTFEIEGEFKVSDDESISLSVMSNFKQYFSKITKSTNALLKNYVAIAKTINVINSFVDEDEQEAYINNLYSQIIDNMTVNKESETSVLHELYSKFFTYKGNSDFTTIIKNTPHIPEKKSMCAYTGTLGTEKYNASMAFGLSAKGYTNRTVASLKNEKNYVSKLMAEENKLRKSAFKRAKSNHVVYYDFFETTLDINPDIIQSSIKARNHEISEDGIIKFDKAAKFQPTNKNLEFIEVGSNMVDTIWLIRNSLIVIKNLNIRMYITGIMSPYNSHKECFYYENSPRFVKDLKWNKVRLFQIDEVLDEIDLLFALGKSKKSINSGLVLNYSENPNFIFRAFYEFKMRRDNNEVISVANKLQNFITKYPQKIRNMTTIEKIVDVALKIQSSAQSGSEETWLMRTALDFIRKNRKENRNKEDTIQQIGGHIYKTLRQEYVSIDVIQDFARLVYEELYEKEWKEKIPTINRQKDWIYQFAFVYKIRVNELINDKVDEKIIEKIKKKNIEFNSENIITELNEKQKYFADKIVDRILNKVNNK